MEEVTISCDKEIDSVIKFIDNYSLDNKIKIDKKLSNDRIFLKCSIINGQSDLSIDFYDIIANIVTDIIINYYSKAMIGKKVFYIYREFSREEKLNITNIAYNMLKLEGNFIEEKSYIYDEILDYIKRNNSINIDGFVKFRLKKFKNNIDCLIDKSAKQYFAEEEYKEFIKILKYFVDIQEPKLDLVNIVIDGEDYKLFDGENNIIEKDYFSDVINELASEGISNDDLLISSLIVIAPEKIIIHGEEKDRDKDIVKIINSVFPEKVYFCSGCKICKTLNSIKKSD